MEEKLKNKHEMLEDLRLPSQLVAADHESWPYEGSGCARRDALVHRGGEMAKTKHQSQNKGTKN